MKKILFITAILIGFLGSAQDSIVKAVSLKGRGPFLVKGSITGTTITGAQIVDSLNTALGSTDWQDGATTSASDLTSGTLPDARLSSNALPPTVSQNDAEAGTSTSVYRWTPQRVAQAIDNLAIIPDDASPRKGLIWGPGTKAEFYADYPYPSTGFPSNGIAFITDSIAPPKSFGDLSDITKGSPLTSSQGTLRVLADPDTDGNYNEVDWTPPGGGSPTTDASELITGVLADGRVQESNVTQHEAALTITESQISDFGSYMPTTSLIDDDTFATATSTNIPSAESVKAYVDANAGGGSVETGISIINKIDDEIGTDWKNGKQEAIDTIQQYATISVLPAVTGNESDVYAMVTSEVDSLNGMYGIMEGTWKMMYHISDPRAPFIRVSPNLIDQGNSDFLSGYDIDNMGNIVVDVAKYTSQYIPVRKGSGILAHPGSRYALYDFEKNLIPIGPIYNGGNNHGFGVVLNLKVIDSTVAYVRIDGSLSTLGTSNQIVYSYDHVGGSVSSAWVDYNELYLRDNVNFTWEKEGLIYPRTTNNLYDFKKGDYTIGYNNNGAENTNTYSTGFIPVESGIPYSTNVGTSTYTFWDIDKNFISGTTANSVVAPPLAKYMKVRLAQTVNFRDFVITQGTYPRPVYQAETSTETLQNIEKQPYTICLIGDSIGTEGDGYATQASYGGTLADTFRPIVYHNVSVSGKSAKTFALDINTGAYNMPMADLYIITLAANDYNFNTAIGTYGDVHPTQDTYFGALQKIENDLIALNPDATIVFMTPFPRMGNQEANILGNVVEDYANAMIYYARMKGHTVIDLFREVPFNNLNGTIVATHTKGIGGEPDGRHPTNLGHRIYIWPQIASIIKTELEKL